MAEQLLARAQQAAFSAFMSGKLKCKIHGVILQIEHAYGNNYQVLLPDESELFRIVGNRKHAKIFVV